MLSYYIMYLFGYFAELELDDIAIYDALGMLCRFADIDDFVMGEQDCRYEVGLVDLEVLLKLVGLLGQVASDLGVANPQHPFDALLSPLLGPVDNVVPTGR